MPRTDDPIEQIRSLYVSDEEDFATGVTRAALSKGLPVLGSALSFLRSKEQREIQREFNDHLLDILKAQERDMNEILERISEPEIARLAARAVERIFWGASRQKARRFAAVLAHHIDSTNEKVLEDAASFIKALDELSEADLKALHHLYRHQSDLVLEDRTPNHKSFFEEGRMEQLLQDGIALEEFFSRCERLRGYGLALEMDGKSGGLSANMKAYRMTVPGRHLIEIIRREESG